MGSLCGSESGHGTWIWTWIWAWTWIWTKKPCISNRFSCFLTKHVTTKLIFVTFFIQKWSFGLKFASQAVTLQRVYEGGFSKGMFFLSAGGRHGREGNSACRIKFCCHMAVRNLNAGCMFKEKCVKLTREIWRARLISPIPTHHLPQFENQIKTQYAA